MLKQASVIDTVGLITAFEDGSASGEDIAKLFAHLLKTGLCWQLQGLYGRTATALICNKVIFRDGTYDEELAKDTQFIHSLVYPSLISW
jgi:hypothetical protein